MKQQLENIADKFIKESEENLKVYQIRDLEYLSASALYIGSKPFKPLGSRPINFAIIPSKPLRTISNNLIIRPLGKNISLHIHEGAGGTAQIKTSKNEYQSLNSYESAMIDLQMDKVGLKKIYTNDNCKRIGRK
jgi:hypothetical protein